ncbi:MAG: Hsp20/alpha crystallin family protein [Candidatus Micrarchaeota archaeon]|nr:Hsp20/alpha crystallin family protein [Candidatus Micrarchaeota archaeon]
MKRRRFSIFDDDYFERIFERMMEEMTKGFEDIEELEKRMREGKSYVRGFSITIGPDGKPIIREFGDRPEITPKGIEEKREPLVDIINEKKNIKIIAELPGVRKEDIDLKADEKTIEIKVDTAERKYYKKLDLPAKIKPETADARYNNGVLEITIEKVEPSKEEEKRKKINIK